MSRGYSESKSVDVDVDLDLDLNEIQYNSLFGEIEDEKELLDE